MIRLVIKGTAAVAVQAAKDRGIMPVITQGHTRYAETILDCADAHHKAVAEWYGEPSGSAPWPDGALVHYSVGVKNE